MERDWTACALLFTVVYLVCRRNVVRNTFNAFGAIWSAYICVIHAWKTTVCPQSMLQGLYSKALSCGCVFLVLRSLVDAVGLIAIRRTIVSSFIFVSGCASIPGPGRVHPDIPAPDRTLVQNLDGIFPFRFSLHFDEPESLGETRRLVRDQLYACDLPELIEHISQFFLGIVVRKISNVDLHQFHYFLIEELIYKLVPAPAQPGEDARIKPIVTATMRNYSLQLLLAETQQLLSAQVLPQ